MKEKYRYSLRIFLAALISLSLAAFVSCSKNSVKQNMQSQQPFSEQGQNQKRDINVSGTDGKQSEDDSKTGGLRQDNSAGGKTQASEEGTAGSWEASSLKVGEPRKEKTEGNTGEAQAGSGTGNVSDGVKTGGKLAGKDAVQETSKTDGSGLSVPRAETADDKSKKENIVRISIVGPEDRGVILPETDIQIEAGDTVLDVLVRVTKQNKIHMEHKGRKITAYIEGIDNIYEFDYGQKSGWVYKVNGAVSGKSAGACDVKSGDSIEWIYTLDLGKELNDGSKSGGA